MQLPFPGGAIPARAAGGGGHAALRLRTVEVFFQWYAGVHGGSGIQGLTYEVVVGGADPRTGTTGRDGKITIRMAPGTNATLRILGSEYRIELEGTLHPIAEMRGVQQRLGMLGHYTGALQGDNGRADTFVNPNVETEKAILDFQADGNLFADAQFGPKSSQKLTKEVTDAGGE